MYKTIEDRY